MVIGVSDIVMRLLWPIMDDRSVITAMRCSRSSYAQLNKFSIRTALTNDVINAYRLARPIITHVLVSSLDDAMSIRSITQESVTAITFDDMFNQQINISLPYGITHITFSYKSVYNYPLLPNVLPSTLTHLRLGRLYNQPLSNSNIFPLSLTHLIFDYIFDQPLHIGIIPNTLTHLIFNENSNFNHYISKNVLPQSLIYLSFGYAFNQLIDNIHILPRFLKFLEFGWSFNQYLDIGILPKTLNHLIVGYSFNHILSINILPNSLKILEFKYGQYTSQSPIVVPSDCQIIGINTYSQRVIRVATDNTNS